MKVLMVCSEMVPFAKTGGLGDMVAALTAELARLGHEVKVVMPRYYDIDTGDLEYASWAIHQLATTGVFSSMSLQRLTAQLSGHQQFLERHQQLPRPELWPHRPGGCRRPERRCRHRWAAVRRLRDHRSR